VKHIVTYLECYETKQILKCSRKPFFIVDYCRRLLISMTYRHKRDQCTKEARDILENILCENVSNYDMTGDRGGGIPEKTRDTVHIENGANVLVSDVDRENNNLDEMEEYRPSQEFDFEAREVKEGFEKKKKKRNYIEFRADYVKIK
jgi:hypothetical protein